MFWIDNARVKASFAVIVIHVAAPVVTGVGEVGSVSWWAGNLYDSFARWCVPVFVMISGFLLLNPEKDESLHTFYEKRASRLLVPILFWTLFYSFYTYIKGIFLENPVTLSTIWENILFGKPFIHMWFLYMIFGLYLVTPFLRKLVRALSVKELTYLCIILFILASLNYYMKQIYHINNTLFTNMFLPFLPYYLLGHLLGRSSFYENKKPYFMIFVLFSIFTAIGCYLLSIYSGIEYGLYFYGYLSITVIFSSISMFVVLKNIERTGESKLMMNLAPLTLGIYLIHPVFLQGFKFFDFSPIMILPIVSIPVFSLVAFVLSAITVKIIMRFPYVNMVV